ncbi:hypothetical protein A33Q_2255 [Indibacter alkaliphilus LW1]|uniref:Uncharacterized protein n=1 Tax=Indibacter alkaliphilus (strain CCUG 57479 / KCTC 22604 / LW1) TaxID=1189612 RepID=S2DH84_INDAL|nr:hypothetical protein [Indibacter alkaliphilus]EOZ96485.1 hypothetical protein A33Q_2255 [Indibacter alkaliphilus LW1]
MKVHALTISALKEQIEKPEFILDNFELETNDNGFAKEIPEVEELKLSFSKKRSV